MNNIINLEDIDRLHNTYQLLQDNNFKLIKEYDNKVYYWMIKGYNYQSPEFISVGLRDFTNDLCEFIESFLGD